MHMLIMLLYSAASSVSNWNTSRNIYRSVARTRSFLSPHVTHDQLVNAAVPWPVNDYRFEPGNRILQECNVLVVGDSRSFMSAYPTIAATGLRPARLGRTAADPVGASEGAQVSAVAVQEHTKCVIPCRLYQSPVMGAQNRCRVAGVHKSTRGR